jgi:16S rRNA (cytidine1402-2'-O)-methyltransferase
MIPTEAPVGRLVVCPTPIGNLEDITLRVLRELREADLIACEDTRRTRILLARHEIDGPLTSLHEHNETGRARELVSRIARGETVALVSDAGTPLISDPGFELLRGCLQAGLHVDVLPGPSAVLTALLASGLPAASWRFVGFLPRARAERRSLFAQTTETLVAFESPRRLAATLAELAALDPDRPVAVCRELTKLHEEVGRGTAAELAERFGAAEPRGEIVLVCGAAQAGGAAREEALEALRELVDAGARARPAASALARLTGLGANELYRGLVGTGK